MADPVLVGFLQLHIRSERKHTWVFAKVFRLAAYLVIWGVLVGAKIFIWHFFEETKTDHDQHHRLIVAEICKELEPLVLREASKRH